MPGRSRCAHACCLIGTIRLTHLSCNNHFVLLAARMQSPENAHFREGRCGKLLPSQLRTMPVMPPLWLSPKYVTQRRDKARSETFPRGGFTLARDLASARDPARKCLF